MAENKGFKPDGKTYEVSHDSTFIEMTYKGYDGNTADEQMNDSATEKYSSYQRMLLFAQSKAANSWTKHARSVKTICAFILILVYFAYFGYALYYRLGDEESWRLFGFTIFTVVIVTVVNTRRMYSTEIGTWWDRSKINRHSKGFHWFQIFTKWFLRIGVFVLIVVYVIVDIAIKHPQNLMSVAGLLVCILVFYITSINPAKVNWHTVFWGIAMQYVFALLILRTYWGYGIFRWLGDRVQEFLHHADAGILFVFGEKSSDHFFAMRVLPIAAFFYTFMNILYYLGAMQAVIRVIGRFLAFCMGTTPAESISTSANIFVSMVESPLMIQPFLKHMTRSELHAVMTGGFATIAGGVLAAYITFGVPANHLLSASVMSAPAALALSKLSYPETEVSQGTSKDFDNLQKSTEHNIIEAATNGATACIKIIGSVAVNVLAFLSLLTFLNATLTWFGDRVGVENLTFELICSYALYPVSFLMGTERADCRKVAELIGIKTFTNEFIAYSQLKDLIANRKAVSNYTTFYNTTEWHWENDDVVLGITGEVLKGGVISIKSEVIATYALCGFANFGSIGITLGGVGALVPSKRPDLASMALRSMICGNVACFLTACIASLLFKDYE